MLVHDIVQVVQPGAPTSSRPGRWHETHRDGREDAERIADRFNHYCSIDGVKYVVETHDEESPDRAATHMIG